MWALLGLYLRRRFRYAAGAVLPRTAPAWMDRLARWLEPFETCFGHVAQRGAFRRYLHGLLSDSPRKSMSSMLARIHDPGSYQAFQHFITHAPWDVAPVWRRLLRRLPDRRGVLILDDTGFPKQGTHSVGVQRQVLGHARQDRQLSDRGDRGAVDGCARLVARRGVVPAAGVVNPRASPAGAHPGARAVRREMAARADPRRPCAPRRNRDRAGRGRCGIRRYSRLSHGIGSSAGCAMCSASRANSPSGSDEPPAALGPSTRAVTAASIGATQVAAWAAQQPARVWRRVTWRNGRGRAWHARFFAVRVTPVVLWRQHRTARGALVTL